jgi:hypothetical protein
VLVDSGRGCLRRHKMQHSSFVLERQQRLTGEGVWGRGGGGGHVSEYACVCGPCQGLFWGLMTQTRTIWHTLTCSTGYDYHSRNAAAAYRWVSWVLSRSSLDGVRWKGGAYQHYQA